MLFSKKSPAPFFATPCRDMPGVDGLQLLTQQIAAQVHTLVSLPQAEGTPADLLQSLYTAFTQGLAIVGGLMNAVSPINRIPQELLETIFALSPDIYPHPTGSQAPYWPFEEPDMDDLHTLSKVCRYWRELALATPTLWNTIITLPPSPERYSCFGRSIYLPDDTSINLKVHFDPYRPSKHSMEKMIRFMLTNSRRIRELHAWNTSSVGNLPRLLQSFDATALEHCMISHDMGCNQRGKLTLFSNGGARLRSLALTDFPILPANQFPALTLLRISFPERYMGSLYWAMNELVAFLAGCPQLEEVYVFDMSYSERRRDSAQDETPVSPDPISLPRLRYLAFTYHFNTDSDNVTGPTDRLLSLVSIPPTCHMYLPAPLNQPAKGVADILASVCRHVPGKDAVSHMFLRLSDQSSLRTMQIVFRQGSLRLQMPRPTGGRGPSASAFTYHDFFHTFRHTFGSTEELRIHYTSDSVASALSSHFPAAVFRNIAALSVICDVDSDKPKPGQSQRPPPTLSAGLAHLVQPLPSGSSRSRAKPRSESPRSAEEPEREHAEQGPYPALDTLWVSVESSDDIAQLKMVLATRAALGPSPIRRLLVTLRCPRSLLRDSARGDANGTVGPSAGRNKSNGQLEDGGLSSGSATCSSDPVNEQCKRLADALVQAGLDVEDITVMDAEATRTLREVDWMTRLPERYDLPSCIHRDWPVIWST